MATKRKRTTGSRSLERMVRFHGRSNGSAAKPLLTKGFGERLRDTRQTFGMTQDEVAQKSGLTNVAISHFECGRRLPSLENYARIVQAIGTNAEYMIGLRP